MVNASIVIVLADLLRNASDPDGDTLSVQNLVASSGTLVDNHDGTWAFTPDQDDTTDVTFNYEVTDGEFAVAQTASLDLVASPGNTIAGTSGNDIADGAAGSDKIFGGSGNDILVGGDGDDIIFGEEGDDTIYGGTGDDVIFGGDGDDTIFGGDGDDIIFGQDGNDIIDGGLGADTVDAGSGDDHVIASVGDGNDKYDGGSGIDTYDLSGTSADAIVDLAAETASSAETGNDQLVAFENVIGGLGDDTILASDAVNVLTGGGGDDSFVFRSLEQAGNSHHGRDHITDFQPGDIIDLSAIDANSHVSGNQSFILVFDTQAFTHAGEIRYRHEQRDDGEHTIVEGDVDGDHEADFEIDTHGRHDFTASDFAGVA